MKLTISHKQFLDIVVSATQCLIPTEELTSEQLEVLDNLTYKYASRETARAWKADEVVAFAPTFLGLVFISRRWVKALIDTKHDMTVPISLLTIIKTTLHEIIHNLYHEYTEEQVVEKTNKWLNDFDWSDV